MTSHSSTTLPPRWAESLLRMLLPPEDRDSVSGDLLEEYRESVLPALGDKARRWYVRQVAGYVLRKAWIWGALVGAVLVTRYLLDTLAPVRYTPGVLHPRSAMMSYGLMATFALGSGWQAWRSGHLGSGVVVAFAAAACGGALSAAGTAVCLAIWHDPGTLTAVRSSGGLAEALWGVPLLLVPIGLITGTTGAIAGRLANAVVYGVSRRNTKRG
ncbi:MAG: permease prefix domain 2-containing transporter [Acidobacteriota bacterium]